MKRPGRSTIDVAENLQLSGYTMGRDRRKVEDSIEMCFEAFPRLRERRSNSQLRYLTPKELTDAD